MLMVSLHLTCKLITGVQESRLFPQTRASFAAALASGTTANRQSQARAYTSFMIEYRLQVFHPTSTDIMMYVQLLVNSGKTIGTVKNYVSGAKLFVAERGGNAAPFSSHMLLNFIKGVNRHSSHVPQQAVSIPLPIITQSCQMLISMSSQGEVLAAAILFAYTTMLRQCHLFYTKTGHMHIIRRGDLELRRDLAIVTVRSSKTTGHSHTSLVQIDAAPSSPHCPVRSLRNAMSLVPAGRDWPIFLDPVTRRLITASHANLMLRLALSAVGFKESAQASFHSLRRASAQLCAKAGVPIQDLKTHGMWRSASISSYVPRPMLRTSKVISQQLVNN